MFEKDYSSQKPSLDESVRVEIEFDDRTAMNHSGLSATYFKEDKCSIYYVYTDSYIAINVEGYAGGLGKVVVNATDFYNGLIADLANRPEHIRILKDIYFDQQNISNAMGKETSLEEEILKVYQSEVAGKVSHMSDVEAIRNYYEEVRNNVSMIRETCAEHEKAKEELTNIFAK